MTCGRIGLFDHGPMARRDDLVSQAAIPYEGLRLGRCVLGRPDVQCRYPQRSVFLAESVTAARGLGRSPDRPERSRVGPGQARAIAKERVAPGGGGALRQLADPGHEMHAELCGVVEASGLAREVGVGFGEVPLDRKESGRPLDPRYCLDGHRGAERVADESDGDARSLSRDGRLEPAREAGEIMVVFNRTRARPVRRQEIEIA